MTEESLFLAALEKPVAERQGFLAEACAGDAGLRGRIELLLAAHEKASGILEHRPAAVGTADQLLGPELTPGTVIAGRYKLLDCLGEGGMGTVWAAEQLDPVKRKVALKLIKPGMDSRTILTRFDAERQALAVMDHPNIAKVFDGGMTPPTGLAPGRPFFVMEFVPGVPLTEYCDKARLSITDRLQLFVPICQAVQHAHQKGIVHRDLKPSNILVHEADGKGVPKIIDFGLAKALHAPLTDHSLQTAVGMILGTPLYMSPEQAELSNVDIDTRTDTYSLGVILYELLTGTTPLERKRFAEAAWMEIARLIIEEEPPTPSSRLSHSDSLPSVAAQRQLEPVRLSRLLRGDLDWIVMKCLEKDRTRRYATANALARDIERYLCDEPVEAGPPSAAYRLRKFIRRNRGPVLAAAALVALIVLGAIVSTWQAVRATRAEAAAVAEGLEKDKQRVRAEEAEALAKERLSDVSRQKQVADVEARTAKAINDFLNQDLLQQVGGGAMSDQGYLAEPGLTVRAALDRAASRIGDRFRDQPLVEAGIQHTIGTAYVSVGEPGKAVPHLERARDLFGTHAGRGNQMTVRSMSNLAGAYWHTRRLAQAVPLFEQTIALAKELLGPDHVDTLAYTNNLAVLYMVTGKADQAIPLLAHVLARRREKLGPGHRQTLATLNNLAAAHRDAGKIDQAVPLYEQALAERRQHLGADHHDTFASMHNLAGAFLITKQPQRATPLLEEALKGRKAKLGPDHPDTLDTMASLGVGYREVGRMNDGLPLLEEAYRRGRRYPALGWVGNALLVTYAQAGKFAEAGAHANERITALRAQLPADSPQFAGILGNIASALERGGAYAQAEPLLREWVAIRMKIDPNEWTTFNAQSVLGGALLGQKKYAEAEPLLVQGYQGLRKVLAPGAARDADPTPPSTRQLRIAEALDRLIQLYDQWGKPDEAATWRNERDKRKAAAPPAKP
jgi:tetratricopeptide (TPR) repeat protein